MKISDTWVAFVRIIPFFFLQKIILCIELCCVLFVYPGCVCNFFSSCFIQVSAISVILSKYLNQPVRFQREAAAAALSEFVRHRYVWNTFPPKHVPFFCIFN